MSRTYKHQATYDYLNGKKVKGNLLYGVKRYFNRINFSKWDYSRILWFKYKTKRHERE